MSCSQFEGTERARRGQCLYLKRSKFKSSTQDVVKKTMALNIRTCFIKAEASHPFVRTKISELSKREGHQGPSLSWSVHLGPLNWEKEAQREATFSIGGVPLCHIPNERLMNWTELLGERKGALGTFSGPLRAENCVETEREMGKGKRAATEKNNER